MRKIHRRQGAIAGGAGGNFNDLLMHGRGRRSLKYITDRRILCAIGALKMRISQMEYSVIEKLSDP
jgi:hypothetical protein